MLYIIPGGPAGYVTGKLAKELTEVLADKVATNALDYASGRICSKLRDAIIDGTITTWSETVDASSRFPETSSSDVRQQSLAAWIISLRPDGVDPGNPLSVNNEIERLQADDSVLSDAYADYAAQRNR